MDKFVRDIYGGDYDKFKFSGEIVVSRYFISIYFIFLMKCFSLNYISFIIIVLLVLKRWKY